MSRELVMPTMKTAIAPASYGLRTRALGMFLGASVELLVCGGLLLFVGLASAGTQELPVELPPRVPAQFMSYQGAGWLERPERVAEEMPDEMLEILQGYVEEEGLTGIVPVLSEFDDPKLPEGEIDWILLVDVYHEFGNPGAMLAKMREALKRDGRVALLEYRVEDGTGDQIKGDHRMSVRQVLSEWGPAGFELIELH
jgi:hypothetical protein